MAALIRQLIFWRGCLNVEISLSKGLCTGLVKEKEWKFPEHTRGEGSQRHTMSDTGGEVLDRVSRPLF